MKANALENGFVYLKQVAPKIQQSVRYYSTENFIGKKIEGYNAPEIILTEKAAEALKNLNEELLLEGYELVVYDGYRPQMAVDDFVHWGRDDREGEKALYFPSISKEDIFKRGFVAYKSSHSRGSTVDLTIIKKGKKVQKIKQIKRNGLIFLDDGTVDMGVHFDFFGTESWASSPLMPQKYNKIRAYLKEKMEKYGFKGMAGEWWHFTLKEEPFPDTYFTFTIESAK